jgi:hypothetical protein
MVHNTDQFLPRTLWVELDSKEIFSFTTIPVSIICYLSILVLLSLLCSLEEPHHKYLLSYGVYRTRKGWTPANVGELNRIGFDARR